MSRVTGRREVVRHVTRGHVKDDVENVASLVGVKITSLDSELCGRQ